jgi:hypothetical protein
MALKWKIYVSIKKYFWILLALSLICLRFIGNWYPQLIETFYSRGFFLMIRGLIDYTIAALPIPMFYIFFAGLFFTIINYFRKSYQKNILIKERFFNFCLHVLQFASIIIVWFLVSWGFNYGRVPIEEQLGLQLEKPSEAHLFSEVQWATKKTLDLRRLVYEDTFALDKKLLPKDLESEMRNSLEDVLNELGYPTFGKVRARQLYPKGILLRLKTAGIYWFFVGEGNLDAGLHSLQKPFTMAHEMAHGYGFGDEGTCNFLAYLTCLKSNQAYVQYAGMLTYWRYVASEYKYRNPENYALFRAEHLSAGMKNDLTAIYENSEKYPDYFPKLRNQTYDSYLKLQGIEDGIENYSRVTLLVDAWRR